MADISDGLYWEDVDIVLPEGFLVGADDAVRQHRDRAVLAIFFDLVRGIIHGGVFLVVVL